MMVRSTALGILLAALLARPLAAESAATLFVEGESAFRRGDYAEAAALFARARDADSRDVWAPYLQGLSLWKSGRAIRIM